MPETDIKALFKEGFATYNRGDFNALGDLYAEDAVVEFGSEFKMTGPKGALQILDYFADFIEGEFTQWRVFTRGNEALVEATLKARYFKTYPGYSEATGQILSIPVAISATVNGGKVIRSRLIHSAVDWVGMA